MPNLYIIAGCNGAGKTTASFTVLPEMLNCEEFVNADEIARGLSPFNPDKAAIEAGRLMLKKVDSLIGQKVDFAFETTLSSRSFVNTISKAKGSGYQVTLLFFWLESVNLAIERVKIRVEEGGHNIPEDVIRRRYYSGLKNLFKLYIPVCDEFLIFDNSEIKTKKIAERRIDSAINIFEKRIFEKIKTIANEYKY